MACKSTHKQGPEKQSSNSQPLILNTCYFSDPQVVWTFLLNWGTLITERNLSTVKSQANESLFYFNLIRVMEAEALSRLFFYIGLFSRPFAGGFMNRKVIS